MSTAPGVQLQISAVAAALTDPAIIALVGVTAGGPAIFAPNQPWDDVFPRLVFQPPLILPRDTGCMAGVEAWLDVDCLASGADSTLVASALADATRIALDVPLDLDGWLDAAARRFQSATPLGDPDPLVERIRVSLRYRLNPIPS